MSFLAKLNFNRVVFDSDRRAVFKEIPVNGLNVASLEPGEFAGKNSIEVVGEEREGEVEIDLDDDG